MSEHFTTVSAPRRLGDFEIVRELGRGGMGIVYEARQVSLNRKVALKVLSGSLGLTTKAVIRFKREAEAAAKLHHTNIVPIYATGEHEGTHYYAMELIDGPGLDQVIEQMRQARQSRPGNPAPQPEASTASAETGPAPAWAVQTMGYEAAGTDQSGPTASAGISASSLQSGGGYFDQVARMMADVADALDYAHAQGVIHRDIKPSNLLLSPDGRLHINDFGLARMLEQPGMTVSGEFVGSPTYMSPEQITAGRVPLDHRTDIYSLGASLYELLTLQPPFLGQRRDQVLAQIIHKEPAGPRKVNRKVPHDLETICLKSMEKDPDKRYQTAGDLAKDLRAYVNRFAISARRVGSFGKVVRWTRRNKVITAMLAGILALGLMAAAFAWRARAAQQQLLVEHRRSALERAMVAAMNGDVDGARTQIERAELLKASATDVHLVQGLLASYLDEPEEAIRHLEQAVRLAPESIVAHALLQRAYGSALNWPAYELESARVEALKPVSSDDYLFKGFAVADGWDPARGLENMDTAIRMRDSALARLMRAGALGVVALDRSDIQMLEKSLRDIQEARDKLGDVPEVLRTSLFINNIGIATYSNLNRRNEQRKAEAEAARYCDLLLKQSHLSSRIVRELHDHFVLTRDYNSMLALCARVERQSDFWCARLSKLGRAGALYHLGRIDEALAAAAAARKQPGGTVFDGILLMLETDDPATAVESAIEKAENSGLPGNTDSIPWGASLGFSFNSTYVRFVVGHKAEAIAAARRVLKQSPRWTYRGDWYPKLMRFAAGELSADELLKEARPSILSQCEANMIIGARLLSDGDRDGAREHFEACVNTNVFFYTEYEWASILLDRMRQDPTWPHCIPMRNRPTTRSAAPPAGSK